MRGDQIQISVRGDQNLIRSVSFPKKVLMEKKQYKKHAKVSKCTKIL